jgi:hypothetical protein
MQMSEAHVLTCLAEDCSYNCREVCCAPAVEIGAEHPACDTFTTGSVPVGAGEPGVQDCKVMDCHFNNAESCTASGITMITHSGHADCATFRQ